jgi:hypothetical protein
MIPMTTAIAVRELQKKYGTKAMALAITIALICLVAGYKAACRGIVLGALFSTINFVLMAQTFHAKIGPDRKIASISALRNIIFRYTFLAIPLFIAIKLPRFDLMATVGGLFMVQVIILSDHIFRMVLFPWRK